jgi:mono/diheme cytochrome c family protein
LRNNVTTFKLALGLGLALAVVMPLAASADPPGDPTAATQDEQGLWHDKNGDPTYKVEADGTVDWNTFSGFRRYNAACIVCHGPDGAG